MKYLKRFDVLAVIILLTIALILGIVFMLNGSGKGTKEAVIYKDGCEIYRINLSTVAESYTLPLNDDTGISFFVENDGISFKESNCPDKICVNTGKISSNSQTAVCLPNEVYVKIISSEGQSNDAITG